MSTATLERELDTTDAANYRALYSGAILGAPMSLVAGVTYLMASIGVGDTRQLIPLALLPIAAAAICLYAYRRVRANREIYTGERIALAGAVFAVVSFLAGSTYGAYVYATEVPAGYQRSSFTALQPGDDDLAAGRPIPTEIQSFIKNDTDVFLKGYIRPESVKFQKGNKEFLLVRDNNACCFGDLSKVMFYDQVQVELQDNLTADYSGRVFRVGGKLSCRLGDPRQGEPELVYSMKVDYLK